MASTFFRGPGRGGRPSARPFSGSGRSWPDAWQASSHSCAGGCSSLGAASGRWDSCIGAAFGGGVNFVVDEPGELGAITVSVQVEEPSVEEFIDLIAPPTKDGEPIDTGKTEQ